jgi:hypothetical protein
MSSIQSTLIDCPTRYVERMNMHRLRASIHGRASRFRNRSWIARRCSVNPVAIQRGLQDNGGLHSCRSSG